MLRAALALALLLAGSGAQAGAPLPAFPGAAGFGATTPGGRGGRVLFVSNLRDAGPGSLRAAVEARGPRTVVFRVGGTIVLRSSLRISSPFLTLAGQTAPGGGIQLQNHRTGSRGSDSFPSLRISTHDVVIRHLRIRPGMPDPDPACADASRPPPKGRCVPPNDVDAIALEGDAHDIVIDHVSAFWATDEIVAATSVRDLTLQWSILAEGLDYMLYGPGKKHDGKGLLLGNKHAARQGRAIGRVSIHHNLFAHVSIRSPMLNPSCPDVGRPADCVSDVANNVIYNWGTMATHVANGLGHAFANVVGNYYRRGPSTAPAAAAIGLRDWTAASAGLRPGSRLRLHLAGNVEDRAGQPRDATIECFRLGQRRPDGAGRPQPCELADYAAGAFATPEVRTGTALEILEPVLGGAGASRSLDALGELLPARDEADRRVVEDVRRGSGTILRRRESFPGWPSLAPGVAPLDGDADGMPDAWERRHGFPPAASAAPDADADGDGYTDLEEYLNGSDPTAAGR